MKSESSSTAMPSPDDQPPTPRFRWRRFFLGFIAPVAAPLAAVILLVGYADQWVFIFAWGVAVAAGFRAGLKYRSWEFMFGMLTAIAVFLVLLLLNRLGMWPW